MRGLAYVVILNWNGRSYLRDCLRAAFAQTYPDYRVLVVDNGSTDGSADIAHDEFPEAILLPLERNLHYARGSNEGMRAALRDPKCAYVVLLNNDTRADPEWLAEMVRSVDGRIGMVASKLLFMDRPKVVNSAGIAIARDGSSKDRGWNEPDDGRFDTAPDVFGASGGAGLYRREVLDEVGLFDEDFVAYYEDVDLAWRARLAGWEAHFAPRSIVYHKYSGSIGHASPWRQYQCERNRVWNLVQNYPWRYVATGITWNATRLVASRLPRRPEAGEPAATTETPRGSVRIHARARIDAYASLGRALRKRRQRQPQRRVDAAEVGQWLRRYGVSLHDILSP
ncbi:MAG: glycosyltransferase family 2 protein [Thermoplasmata archaeon]